MTLRRNQSGFTLILGLVVLVAMTFVMVSAVNINMVDLKITQNVESKELLKFSAQQAIERILNNDTYFTSPTVQTENVNDFVVTLSAAECLGSKPAEGYSAVTGMPPEDTNWALNATATDPVTGATVQIHQGVKVKLMADSCL